MKLGRTRRLRSRILTLSLAALSFLIANATAALAWDPPGLPPL